VNTKLEPFDEDIFDRYSTGLAWFLANRNRDGSWGIKKNERVTYTAQAIQLLISAHFDIEGRILKKAIRWMEDEVKPSSKHWYSRLEIGLLIGDFEKLATRGYLKRFLDDLNKIFVDNTKENTERFFWHFLPTLIALRLHEKRLNETINRRVPHKKVVEYLFKYMTQFRDDCITIQHKPNYTGLVALYLNGLSPIPICPDPKSKVKALVNWLIESKVVEKDTVHWFHSRGMSAYVLMDILMVSGEDSSPIDDVIYEIANHLAPNKKGYVSGDKSTTYETKLHAEALYATVLSLRGLATAIGRYYTVKELDKARNQAEDIYHNLPIFFRIGNSFHRNKSKIPWLLSSLFIILGIILIVLYHKDIGINLIFTAVGSFMGLVTTLLFKNND